MFRAFSTLDWVFKVNLLPLQARETLRGKEAKGIYYSRLPIVDSTYGG
ncbi:MAG: hypothetical protein IMZ61_09090 [Planctomycetes bacterium]|nr:hypothetical protein [Planctomycetota bacterium]